MTAENVHALLHGLLRGFDGVLDEQARVEIRRSVARRTDVYLNLPRTALDAPTLPPLVRSIAAHDAVAEAKLKRGRIEVRMADGYVEELIEDLAYGDGCSVDTSRPLAGESWVISLFGPNASKAIHVGHLRNISYGIALGRLCEAVGGDVAFESVVTDFGRNVAEAIAGYLSDPAHPTPDSRGLKQDHFVGRCYSDYVAGMASRKSAAPDRDDPDAPISRELRAYGDDADAVIEKWFARDPEIREAWRKVLAWTLDGHSETFARCGVRDFDLLYQSHHFEAADELIASGAETGLLDRFEDGSVFFPTGRSDYRRVPLTRPDGMSTEHLRTIAIWGAIVSEEGSSTRWVHVLGDEWRTTTDCRMLLHRKLGYGDGVERYFPVYHGMITNSMAGKGSLRKVSSSAGDAPLLDDEIDALAALPRIGELAEGLGLTPEITARIALSGMMLALRPTKPMTYTKSDAVDGRKNPVVPALEALARSLADLEEGIEAQTHDSQETRFLALQAQSLPVMVELAWTRWHPEHVLRFLSHVSEAFLGQAPCRLRSRLVCHLLVRGLGAVALLPDDDVAAPRFRRAVDERMAAAASAS